MDGTLHNNARRIAVLSGGDSAEREISLASGRQAAAALTEAGYQPAAIDPAVQELESIDWHCFDACFIALHGGAGEDGRVQAALEQNRHSVHRQRFYGFAAGDEQSGGQTAIRSMWRADIALSSFGRGRLCGYQNLLGRWW